MSRLISDLIENRIETTTANAVCNAGGKLLKIVEMEHKYGVKAGGKASPIPVLSLAPGV